MGEHKTKDRTLQELKRYWGKKGYTVYGYKKTAVGITYLTRKK